MAWLKRFLKRKLYIVYEDSHGAVSWWTSKRKAYAEADRLVKEGYCRGCDYECTEQGWRQCDAVTVHMEYLNKEWR